MTYDRSIRLPALLALQEHAGELKSTGIQEMTAVEKSVGEAYQSGIRSILVSAGLVSLLAVIAAVFAIRSIVKPLLALRKGTRVIAQGNLHYRVGTNAGDEIGELSRDFDKMTHSLGESMTSIETLNQEITERKNAEEALRESEGKLRTLISGLDYTGIGMSIFTDDNKILFENQVMKNKFGESTGDFCFKKYRGSLY